MEPNVLLSRAVYPQNRVATAASRASAQAKRYVAYHFRNGISELTVVLLAFLLLK